MDDFQDIFLSLEYVRVILVSPNLNVFVLDLPVAVAPNPTAFKGLKNCF